MGIKNKVTQTEKDYIISQLKAGVCNIDIAKQLNRSRSTIERIAKQHGLSNNPRKYGIPFSCYDSITKLYLSGLTSQQIKDEHYPQFTVDQIGYVVKTLGISRPNGKVAKLNHDYFEDIDTPEKAYWLGLLFADGCVQHNIKKGNSYSITLELQVDDKYLIDQFAKAVKTNLETKIYTNKSGFQRKDGKLHTMAKLVLNSAKMAQDLSKYGVIPNKSLKVSELPNIPHCFMRDFIRGFFDGNGSITHNWTHEHNTLSVRVLFYSTVKFNQNLSKYLSEHIIVKEHKITQQKQSNVSLFCYTNKEAFAFYHYIYDDIQAPYMQRKKKHFEDLITQYRDNYNCNEIMAS